MTEAWSQVAAPAGWISGVLALWSDLAVAFSTCPIHSGVGSCKTTVREKQSWPFLGGKDDVPRLPRRSWAPCSFLCDVSRLGAELRCVSGVEEIKGSSMQEKKATLTQGTPFYSWKCVCVHVCVWGGTCTPEIDTLPIGSGKFKDTRDRDERTSEEQAPSPVPLPSPHAPFLSGFAAARQFIINPLKAAKISSRVV